jgi:hypothetical protein
MDRGPSQAARDLLADEIAAQGPAWANAASSIRGGNYANVWITAALAAIDLALDIDRDQASEP